MEPSAVRGTVQFFHLKGLKPTDIKKELDSVLHDSSPSLKTVCKWVNEFRWGNTSVEINRGGGSEKTVRTEENIEKVRKLMNKDRRFKLREIAEETGLSYYSVFTIVHQDLLMKKVCARWVPRLLTEDNKLKRVRTSEQCLEMIRQDPDFYRSFITMDETWLHHYTPESKQQSMQWIKPGEKAPRKAKAVPSAGKVMASVFWDSSGIIFIDYLPPKTTITGAHYAHQLDQLMDIITVKRPGMKKKKIYFLQDNASPHTCDVAMKKIKDLHFELLPHPPYSPDLAPSDFFLFPLLKKFLAGRRYSCNDEVISAAEGFFDSLPKTDYRNGMQSLQKRLIKCIQVQGDYVEK